MIVPFKAWHLLAIDLQEEQSGMRARFDPDYAAALEGDRARSALVDGKVVACAGLSCDEDGRTFAWAVLGVDARPAMLEATRACRGVLAGAGEVWTMLRQGFEPGEKWLRMLGFERAMRPVEHGPDGRDYETWVRR